MGYFLFPRLDFRELRLTTEFAALMEAPSEAPRFNMLSATCAHCRFDFAERAFFVWREASDGPHGMDHSGVPGFLNAIMM
jgi:hypothetical protein